MHGIFLDSWRFITDGSRHRVLLPSGILWNFGCLRVTMTSIKSYLDPPNWRLITVNARHRVVLSSGILWNFR
ncbi:hypothetical protein B9Z55_006161 [Caenorhabditis nigoni]|uniref:Uncharacterized protein n=1 Tax=Caenorhabditis nigoni TaxID=1611254 RepID=A0A2G5V411_9PELO|nr:hypothetical protein B9Z55_006161 [Caenorhabditis nigoni]